MTILPKYKYKYIKNNISDSISGKLVLFQLQSPGQRRLNMRILNSLGCIEIQSGILQQSMYLSTNMGRLTVFQFMLLLSTRSSKRCLFHHTQQNVPWRTMLSEDRRKGHKD